MSEYSYTNADLESKNNQMRVWLQYKDKEIQNMKEYIDQAINKYQRQQKQLHQNLRKVHEQSSKESQRLNELYEETRQKLQNERQQAKLISNDEQQVKSAYQAKINQLQLQIRKQLEQTNRSNSQIQLWRQRCQTLGKSFEEQSDKIGSLTQQRNKISEQIHQVKKQADRKLKDSQKRCQAAASQLNNLKEQIKLIQNEAGVWKQRMQNLQNQIRLSNQRAEKYKAEYTKEKQSNREFKMLLDNAHCQIQSFKAEVMDKDKLYHQLLQKVSKNDIQRKGLMNQDKKFSDLLEKSRIEVSQLRKKYDDQLKINNILKQQMQKKDLDSQVVKQKSQQYCRKQQQLMESIRSDYTKLQAQLRNTRQSFEDMKKALKKVTLKNEQLEEKVQQLNKQCINAQIQNDQLKKESLRTGIDERQVSYVNRLKQQNTQLKRQLEKLTQQIITLGHQKIKHKAEQRQGKDPDIYALELNKKNSQVKFLQKIIDDAVNILGIKVWNKSIGQSLKSGIQNLQKQAAKAKADLEVLNQDINLKNQKISLLEGQRPKIPKQQDDTLMKMRNKINRTSSNFEAIRQSKQQDKLILQMKDPNKANLWGLNKP